MWLASSSNTQLEFSIKFVDWELTSLLRKILLFIHMEYCFIYDDLLCPLIGLQIIFLTSYAFLDGLTHSYSTVLIAMCMLSYTLLKF